MNGPGEKSFKQLWRELSKAGWKARKPTGIATDHRYVKPGIKGRLEDFKRGRDFFVGKHPLYWCMVTIVNTMHAYLQARWSS
ncbi:hypothetical protein PHMEG_00040147 [Phytophthora megakarya]|uniref:Uncharacterized protein n=1 Tax=Phytophthora megakarya TaxID=4795 RepID=A0A225UDK9_9STRA|nr:hypothetical protein PHMEG_00040147 [Phytophthora megakarya]